MSNKSQAKKEEKAKVAEPKKVEETKKTEEVTPVAETVIEDAAEEVATDKNPVAVQMNQTEEEGFEIDSAASDFENIDMGTFQFFQFSIKKVPQLGKAFTGIFVGIRDGEAEGNKGIDGLDFEDLDGNKFVISSYYQLKKYFSEVSAEDRAKYIYRITLINVNKGGGQGGGDVLIFNVARKVNTNARATSFAPTK